MRVDYFVFGFLAFSTGYFIYFYFWKIINKLVYCKRRIWNVRIKFWWRCLYYRKDEFHISLSKDPCAWLVMTPEEREIYDEKIARRRWRAHLKDLDRSK